jgi:hypothetical protein
MTGNQFKPLVTGLFPPRLALRTCFVWQFQGTSAYPARQEDPISHPDAKFGTETGTFRGAFTFTP